MIEIYQTYQLTLRYVAIAAAVLFAAALFAAYVIAPAWCEIRKYFKMTRIQQMLLGVVVVGFIQYGATKSSFNFDGGIKQNPIQPSVATNNLVSIHWARDTSGGIIVPLESTVYIDYRLATDTNGVWQTLAETTVGTWGWSGTVINATNYNYNVWAYYIPPEPVHTNGVWIYKTLKDRNEKFPLPLRARVEVNGMAISTPKEKRKDEGND